MQQTKYCRRWKKPHTHVHTQRERERERDVRTHTHADATHTYTTHGASERGKKTRAWANVARGWTRQNNPRDKIKQWVTKLNQHCMWVHKKIRDRATGDAYIYIHTYKCTHNGVRGKRKKNHARKECKSRAKEKKKPGHRAARPRGLSRAPRPRPATSRSAARSPAGWSRRARLAHARACTWPEPLFLRKVPEPPKKKYKSPWKKALFLETLKKEPK